MRRTLGWMAVAAALAGCKKDDEPGDVAGPLGIPVAKDGVIYAGAATIDLTPDVVETWTDTNGNGDFDGCLGDPAGAGAGCDEPFDDVNGNGTFDPVWIGGFGPLRPASGVHDPIEANALVLAYDGGYVAMVGLDLVGLSQVRIRAAADALAEEGFDPERLLAASTHNHQGPDTMGLWGDPYTGVTGKNEAYQQRVTAAIAQAVRDAAADMVPVDLRVGRVAMRDVDPELYNGPVFGGINPTAKMHGMVHDIRDPVVVSDQLLVMQASGAEGTVFTWTNWSGHPEVWGSQNLISSDWAGVTRDVLEARYGGVAVHMPESLGGMQSALGGDVPLVDESGNRVLSGSDPVWAEHDSWDFVRSHGWHIADAATLALDAGEAIAALPMKVDTEPVIFPVENVVYQLFAPSDLFDLGLEDAIFDLERCPEVADTGGLGCLQTWVWRVELGPIGLIGVPGELLPELAWGFPDHVAWPEEQLDPTTRGAGSTFFPQHDHDCDALDYEADCTEVDGSVGDCDCLAVHAWSYELSPSAAQRPMLEPLDTEYKAVLGMLGDYLSYIIPEPDFNHGVSLFTDDGDHYEDTVSPSSVFATRIQEAQARLDARW